MIHTMFAPFPTLPLPVVMTHSTLKPVRTCGITGQHMVFTRHRNAEEPHLIEGDTDKQDTDDGVEVVLWRAYVLAR